MATDIEKEQATRLGLKPSPAYEQRKQRYAAGQTPANTPSPDLPDYGSAGNPTFAQRKAEYQAGKTGSDSGPQALPAVQPTLGFQQRQGRYDARKDAPKKPSNLGLIGRGLANAVIGGGSSLVNVPADMLRSGTARVLGGDPNTLPGGATAFSDASFSQLDQGLGQLSAGLEGLQAQGRNALGVKAPQPAAPAPAAAPGMPAAAPSRATAGSSDAGPSTQGQPGLGFQRAGAGIVGRQNPDGSMAFSNAPGDVARASDVQMKSGRMGNGVGGLSVGEAGDSQLALERFQRANDIRAQTIADSRRGTIGDNGNFTIVRDSSRTPTRDDFMRARLNDLEQRSEAVNAGLGLRAREVSNAERGTDLEQQRLGIERERANQELQTGQLGLQQQQQIAELRARLADPNLDPATREEVQRAYNTLTTPAKDRYVLQDTVMGQDALGAPVFGKQALDVTSGQLVGQGRAGARAATPQFEAGKIYRDASGNRARYVGTDAQGNPQWEYL